MRLHSIKHRIRLVSILFLLTAMFGTGLSIPRDVRASQTASPEQLLADMFAPILNLKHQPYECDAVGEPWLPVSVDVVLGYSEVRLMRKKQPGESSDSVVKVAPTAHDLYGKDGSYYLDLPGNSRQPGCVYEKWSRERIAELGLEPSIYARVATDPERPGELALQYWFYWVFDDFNNTHESDWEMIQLTFAANNAEEAMDQEPTQVSFAQHAGGEQAEWDDPKVDLDGSRINVYFAGGSHASYYQDAVWVGWGENGTGFGCDMADPETDILTDAKVILLPESVTQDSEFAWLEFGGRWGDRQPWEFDAPAGPNVRTKWDSPIAWTEDIRQESLAIPANSTVGPGPGELFCSVSSFAGSVATVFPLHPRLYLGLTISVLAALTVFGFRVSHTVISSAKHYAKHAGRYLAVSALLLVVASVATRLTYFVEHYLYVAVDVGQDDPGRFLQFAPLLGFGTIQQFFLSIFVAPLVVIATFHSMTTPPGDLRTAWKVALSRWGTTFLVLVSNALLITLLSTTIILLPLAMYKGVQWFFSLQAVIIDGRGIWDARRRSAQLVHRNWWKALGMVVLVTLLSGAPGPAAGMVLFVTEVVSIETAGVISSVLFAISYPIAIIASTRLYLQLRDGASDAMTVGTANRVWNRTRSIWSRLQPAS